jgi:hypothetical protein
VDPSYRNYRTQSQSEYRTSHYRTIGAIGQLSDFTIGQSDQGSTSAAFYLLAMSRSQAHPDCLPHDAPAVPLEEPAALPVSCVVSHTFGSTAALAARRASPHARFANRHQCWIAILAAIPAAMLTMLTMNARTDEILYTRILI